MLVQGAGGNVSWKDGGTLWIKASGTWLRDASARNIFVPVALTELQQEIRQRRFEAVPRVLEGATLKPSIETNLHALMPQRLVVHVHAIAALVCLVRRDPWPDMVRRLSTRWKPCFVPYHKPGADLARAVNDAVVGSPGTQLVCMANHGVVAAGDSLDEIRDILADVGTLLQGDQMVVASEIRREPIEVDATWCFQPVDDPIVQGLDMTASGLQRMADAWALYPDHVVFLGASPICHDSVGAARAYCNVQGGPVTDQAHFIQDVGVFSLQPLSAGKLVQLRCYADVLLRQPAGQQLQTLEHEQVAALLNWDAERYRQQINLCK